MTAKHEWIRNGLVDRGYTQRDLAKAWGVSDAVITRFIAGTEGQLPRLDRAWQLAMMLGISLEELARGLGLAGKATPPPVAVAAGAPPLGTIRLEVPAQGVIRLLIHRDLPSQVATHVIDILGKAG